MVNFTKRLKRQQGNVSKLEPRFTGPYKVLRAIGLDTYVLELPANSRVHPVFNAEYLRPYNQPQDVN